MATHVEDMEPGDREAPGQGSAHRGPSSLVLLRTRDGKGKTTAACGVVLRAVAALGGVELRAG